MRLHYVDWGGDSPPLVLLHGLASSARIWDLTAPHLRERFRVFALDQRGHGLSDRPDADDAYSFENVTGDLLAFSEALGLDRPVLVGHSWGGNVALQFAADRPGRARGLVLVDGGFLEVSAIEGMTWERAKQVMRPPDIDGVKLEDLLERARNWPDIKDLWDDQLQDMLLSNFEVSPEGRVYRRLPISQHMKIVRAMWEQRPSQLWDRVACPVLMIPAVAREEEPERHAWTQAKLKAIEEAQARLADSRVVVMEDAIHDVPVQQPALLAGIIADFAEGLA